MAATLAVQEWFCCMAEVVVCFQDEVESYAELPSGVLQPGGQPHTLTVHTKPFTAFLL